MDTSDTIAAIATPPGSGGIGVIRISGAASLDILSRVFSAASGRTGFRHATAYRGVLSSPSTNEHIDEVLTTTFSAPRSYTGEDVVEISCHGGVTVLRAALAAVLEGGARLAEPGEFTRRAFLNGRMDLAQAEAVNDLIRSRTDSARRVALRQLDGALSKRVRSAMKPILKLLSRIEAANDFPDDVEDPDSEEVRARLEESLGEVRVLMEHFSSGRAYREGLRLTIAGRVNVGKSSLLNALLRHSRAIVSEIPGTTRDTIEETLDIRGFPVVAVDTAGLRDTDDPVERIGVGRTQAALESADIVLVVFDISEGIVEGDIELLRRLAGKPTLIVLNKVDLLPEEAGSLATKEYLGRLGRSVPVVQTSASSGQGIDQLEDAIAAVAGRADLAPESVVVSNLRHAEALRAASDNLESALCTLATDLPLDMLSPNLLAACVCLGLVTGDTATPDILDNIFADFCIGK